MKIDRRKFMNLAAGGVAASLLMPRVLAEVATATRIKAVAFDAFAVFDPRPISALAESIFPGRGAELSNLWRTRQFEYTWLRTLMQRYVDFRRTTSDALLFAARSLKLELSDPDRARLLEAYFQLKAWPDTREALDALKARGVRLALLSNFTPEMLSANTEHSGLEGYFEHRLSTDLAGAFKPDPRAYQLGTTAFGLPKEQIVFAAFAGWDAAGAKAFGFPTFWVNRQNSPVEELIATPDGTGGIGDLVNFVLRDGSHA